MTASLATLKRSLRAPRMPSARSRTFLCRAWAVTPRLTLGISSLLQVGGDALDRAHVGRVDLAGSAEGALPLGRLLLEDVALVGVPADDLAGAGHAEPLGGAFMSLDLWHRLPLCCPAGRRASRDRKSVVEGK